MKFTTNFWIKISILNLILVASLGVLMRYKIGFEFPYFSQKNIQHAHSHFAFSGWIAHSLYILIIYYIIHRVEHNYSKFYQKSVLLNLIFSYGMIISFFVSGYSFISIVLATLVIFNSWFLSYFIFKDLNKITPYQPSIIWFKAALWFNNISAIGPFYLAYVISSRNFNEQWYLASVYYYLHFQYNGFFTFTCIGFMINKLTKFLPDYQYNKRLFTLFLATCIPAYFLSVLWAKLPMWLYIIVVIAAIMQVVAWFMFVKDIRKALKGENLLPRFAQFMFLYVGLAFTIKLLLQLGSTIPEVSHLAFGFRPVVIAYLHLVLLAVISVYLLAYFYTNELIFQNKKTRIALSVFLVGVFLNELVLGIQGVASFAYFPISHVNEALFIVALMLLFGAVLILISQRNKNRVEISE